MSDKPSPSDITSDLFRRLRKRCSRESGEIVLFEVGDGAGFRNRGWSDAVSMQTWPSKKLVVSGYEVKATRSDWLRELDSPEKNATWQRHCHFWYIVAPKDVVVLAELPPKWGLLVPKGADGLRIASRAAPPDVTIVDIPASLLAAVFRAADNERRALHTTKVAEIREEERKRVEAEIERQYKAACAFEAKYLELAEALGSKWENLETLKTRAAAVRLLRDEYEDPSKLVRNLRLRHEKIAKRLGELEAEIEEKEAVVG